MVHKEQPAGYLRLEAFGSGMTQDSTPPDACQPKAGWGCSWSSEIFMLDY
jgi:hypothetical protein